MKKFPVISKRVISKNGRNFDVEIEKTYDGLSIYMRDAHSGISDNIMVSDVALSVMDNEFSDDYVLLVSYEVSKFEYRLYNHVDKPVIDASIRKFEEWDGDCR